MAKIDVTGFSPLYGADFIVVVGFLFVLAGDRTLWAAALDHTGQHVVPAWEQVSSPDLSISRFTATCESGTCQIVAVTMVGEVWAASYTPGPGRPG